MLEELTTLLGSCGRETTRAEYRDSILEQNCLGKRTVSTRRASDQRLGELYGLDPAIALFRVMRAFWENDERGRPLLAVLLALARDPLLRFSSEPVLKADQGEQLPRQRFTDAISRATGGRFKDEILDKIVRNTASSWTQSGHLQGRSHKVRCPLPPLPTSWLLRCSKGSFSVREDKRFSRRSSLDCWTHPSLNLSACSRREALGAAGFESNR